MDQAELESYCASALPQGQAALEAAMRTLVQREQPAIADALARSPSDTFLDPLWFAYYYAKEPPLLLPQLAFGHVAPALRPRAFPLDTDERGVAYLPGYGYLVTHRRLRPLEARWDPATLQLTLHDDTTPVSYERVEARCVAGSSIAIPPFGNPLYDLTYTDAEGLPVNEPIASCGSLHAPALALALALIDEHQPAYAALLRQAVREVFVFQRPNVNCFATLNAHGTVFLNAGPEEDEVFFVDELVHQCGHVIFNAVTVRRPDFFEVDPDLTLHELGLSQHPLEVRNLYTVFHGLYTESVMVRCLRALDERRVFCGRRAHQLRGRLAFIARKMAIDVAYVRQPGLFSPLGESLLDAFRATFDGVRSERPDLFADDLRGQPYNFDYALYARRNPDARCTAGA